MNNWEQKLQSFYSLMEKGEKNNKKMWRLAFDIKEEFGSGGLKEFSDDLLDSFGISRSYHTLRQYAYIHETVKKYGLPDDLSFTVVRNIVRHKDRDKLIKKIIDEGLSYREILRLLAQEKTKKEWVCPKCGNSCVYQEVK